MTPTRLLTALRAVAAVGLGASLLLLVWYLMPDVGLCGEGGGCDAARASQLAFLGPLPLPAVGAGGFLAILGASFYPGRPGRVVLAALASLAGLVGAALIIAQVVTLGALCPYCMITDVAAVATAVLALLLLRARDAAPAPPHTTSAIAIAAGLLAPLLVYAATYHPASHHAGPMDEPGGPPDYVTAAQRPDKVTIVEFLDFECPACRRQAAILDEVLARHAADVHLVRKHLPLPMHLHARDAARAFLCVEAQGKGEEMAPRLLTMEATDPPTCREAAQALGVDLAAYDVCLTAKSTDDRLLAEAKDAARAGVTSLPTLWVGTTRYRGVQPADELERAIQRARAR